MKFGNAKSPVLLCTLLALQLPIRVKGETPKEPTYAWDDTMPKELFTGKSVTLNWTPSPSASPNCSIELHSLWFGKEEVVYVVGEDVPNDDPTLTFVLPADLLYMEEYFFVIKDMVHDQAVCDYGCEDPYRDITIRRTEGFLWDSGNPEAWWTEPSEKTTIKWTYRLGDAAAEPSHVDIELVAMDLETMAEVDRISIASNISNTGEYTFSLPTLNVVADADYVAEISSADDPLLAAVGADCGLQCESSYSDIQISKKNTFLWNHVGEDSDTDPVSDQGDKDGIIKDEGLRTMNFSEPTTLIWTWRGNAAKVSSVTIELHDVNAEAADKFIVVAKNVTNTGEFTWTTPAKGYYSVNGDVEGSAETILVEISGDTEYFLVIKSSDPDDDWMTCGNECESPYRISFPNDGIDIADPVLSEPLGKTDPTPIVLALLGGLVLGFTGLAAGIYFKQGRNPFTGTKRRGFGTLEEDNVVQYVQPEHFGSSVIAFDQSI